MQPGRRKIVKLDHLPTKKCFKPQPRNHYSWRKSPAPPGMYKSRSKIVGQMMYQYSLFNQISSTVASEEPLVFVDPKMVKWMVKPSISTPPKSQEIFGTSHCDQKLPNSKAATLNNFLRPWKPIEHRFALSRSGSSPPIQSSFSSAWEDEYLKQPTHADYWGGSIWRETGNVLEWLKLRFGGTMGSHCLDQKWIGTKS